MTVARSLARRRRTMAAAAATFVLAGVVAGCTR
jgi:hypothetical protein